MGIYTQGISLIKNNIGKLKPKLFATNIDDSLNKYMQNHISNLDNQSVREGLLESFNILANKKAMLHN